jgi:hypothetical protein
MAAIEDEKISVRIKAAFPADSDRISLFLAILFSTYLQLLYLCALRFISHPLQILEAKLVEVNSLILSLLDRASS